jgi:hypothetical protein
MLLKRCVAIGCVATFLVSCESFNKYEITNYPTIAGRGGPRAALAQASISDEINQSNSLGEVTGTDTPRHHEPPAVVPTCPVYSLPKLPATPELPYDQLDLLNGPNHDQWNKVMEAHVKAMHLYVMTIKNILRDSHEKYLKDCQEYLSGRENSSN